MGLGVFHLTNPQQVGRELPQDLQLLPSWIMSTHLNAVCSHFSALIGFLGSVLCVPVISSTLWHDCFASRCTHVSLSPVTGSPVSFCCATWEKKRLKTPGARSYSFWGLKILEAGGGGVGGKSHFCRLNGFGYTFLLPEELSRIRAPASRRL